MKKLALSLSLFFLACMTATAKSVVFTLSNGTKIYYLLGGETNPVMRFVDGKITVNADSYARLSFIGLYNNSNRLSAIPFKYVRFTRRLAN